MVAPPPSIHGHIIARQEEAESQCPSKSQLDFLKITIPCLILLGQNNKVVLQSSLKVQLGLGCELAI